jgi:uncharacterized membrane protein YeaQ/YmgE (transglycosylase-associated protein family)
MLALSLFWLLIGIIVGTLANAARLRPATWKCQPRGWPMMLSIGALSALVGGWIGVLLIGKYFATGSALWVAVLGVVVVPGLAKLRS